VYLLSCTICVDAESLSILLTDVQVPTELENQGMLEEGHDVQEKSGVLMVGEKLCVFSMLCENRSPLLSIAISLWLISVLHIVKYTFMNCK